MRIMNALRCDDKEGGDTQVVVRGEVEDNDEEVIAAEEQEPPKKEVLRITRKENCYVCLDDVVHFCMGVPGVYWLHMLALPRQAAQGNPLAQVWVVQAQGCTLCGTH